MKQQFPLLNNNRGNTLLSVRIETLSRITWCQDITLGELTYHHLINA